jgi:5-formyltetrahydrofolate cyclo-ligase
MAGLSKTELRRQLRHRRQVIPADLRSTTQWKVINNLRTLLADLRPAAIGLYMATDGELDLAPLAAELWRDNQTVCLPRVVARHYALTFNVWPPFGPTEPDVLGIEAATGAEITPSAMIIPCLGYSRNGYRLGSGGGYYDRTLASLRHPTRTIGVCFTELELPPTFKPEPHDIPLEFVVTGKEVIVPELAKFGKTR